jgi:Electron transfer DM13
LSIDSANYFGYHTSMNKKLVTILVICSVAASGILGFAYWYNTTLNKSKQESSKIVSRAVVQASDKEIASQAPQNPTNPAVDTLKLSTNPATQTPNTTTNTDTLVTPLPAPTVIKPPSFVARSGSFITLDPTHYASGVVQAISVGDRVQIRFNSDFKTNPDGPDLYVWLVKKQNLGGAIGGVDTSSGSYIDLGPLQSKTGTQAYEVTREEFTQADYAVVIWCRAFSVQFSNAILQ